MLGERTSSTSEVSIGRLSKDSIDVDDENDKGEVKAVKGVGVKASATRRPSAQCCA